MLSIKKEKIFNIIWLIYIITIYCSPKLIFKVEVLFILLGVLCIRRIKINFYVIWSILILILFFISNIRAENLINSRIIYYYFMKNLLVGYILVNNIKTKQELDKIIYGYIYAGIALIIRVLTIFPLRNLGKIRLNIPQAGFNANELALNWGVSLIFLFYFIYKTKRKIYVLYSILIMIMIIFTESRKGLFLMLVGLIGYPILASKSRKILVKRVILFFILGISLITICSQIDVIREKILRRFFLLIQNVLGNTQVIDRSADIRMDMIREGIGLIKEHFFMGYGLGEFSLYSKYKTYSHNNYIELLVGTGIIGTICYYLFYVYLIFRNKIILKFREKRIIPFFIMTIILFIIDLGLVSYVERFWIIYLVLNFIAIKILDAKFKRRY